MLRLSLCAGAVALIAWVLPACGRYPAPAGGPLASRLDRQGRDRPAQARAAFLRNQVDSAIGLLKSAAEEEPNRAEVLFWLARIAGAKAARVGFLRRIGPARSAKAAAARALTLEPKNPDYLELQAGILSVLPGLLGGNRDSALVLGMHLYRVDPARGVRTVLEVLGRGSDRWRARNDSIVETINRGTTDDRVTQLRIAEYCADRCPERALAIHQRLVERDSADAYAHYWAGRALVVLRREPRRAQSYLWPVARGLRRPLDFSPPFAVVVEGAAWWRLGHTYVQLRMLDSARICFEEAQQANPGSEVAREAMAALDSLERR